MATNVKESRIAAISKAPGSLGGEVVLERTRDVDGQEGDVWIALHRDGYLVGVPLVVKASDFDRMAREISPQPLVTMSRGSDDER